MACAKPCCFPVLTSTWSTAATSRISTCPGHRHVPRAAPPHLSCFLPILSEVRRSAHTVIYCILRWNTRTLLRAPRARPGKVDKRSQARPAISGPVISHSVRGRLCPNSPPRCLLIATSTQLVAHLRSSYPHSTPSVRPCLGLLYWVLPREAVGGHTPLAGLQRSPCCHRRRSSMEQDTHSRASYIWSVDRLAIFTSSPDRLSFPSACFTSRYLLKGSVAARTSRAESRRLLFLNWHCL